LVRFGAFEADLRTGELRKRGIKLKIQEQPFQVLALLIENAGMVVTREEIQRALWPQETFLDFENGLNAAVAKLRQVLGDSAENPRFIETLPRRGYRFVTPIQLSEDAIEPIKAARSIIALPEDQQLRSDLPAEIERVSQKALKKQPDLRYQHVTELRADLKRVKGDMDFGRVPTALDERRPSIAIANRGLKRRWIIAASAIATTVVGLSITGSYWVRHSRPAPPAVLTAVPLTAYFGRQTYPTFSPDGTQVAFSWDGEKKGNSNIFVKLIGAEPPLRLTNNAADEFSPAWSPDGRWIAFCRKLQGGKHAVVLTSPIPGPEQRQTEVYGRDSMDEISGPFLAWSPDSHWLAIAGGERPGGLQSLFLLSLETGEKRKVTSPPIENLYGDSCPAFSPDGRRLAFSRWNAWASSDLYLLDLSPNLEPVAAPKRITFGNWDAASPAWTEDGKSLIFSGHTHSESTLWRVGVSGSEKPQQLDTLRDHAILPAISRHSNRLAYAQFTLHSSIWRVEIPTPGGKAKPPEKFISSTRNDYAPEISPDGRKIAFWSERSGKGEIWICNADGSNLAQLTSWGEEVNSRFPWSPDSTRLVFSANIQDHSEVYVMNTSGGNPRRITFTHYAANPSWSTDGQWILFDSTQDNGSTYIYKVPAAGGPAVLVRRNPEFWGPREAPDGEFIYGIGGSDNTALVRVPRKGGEKQAVVNLNSASDYTLVEHGIYFTPRRDANSHYSIKFLNTPNGKIQQVASVENDPLYPTVSPDEHWILYSQNEPGFTNLMLVENFR
jgi:Tol biopolymer transport system component/DNA-binding winged helix-turn-helix (wHTH) protein